MNVVDLFGCTSVKDLDLLAPRRGKCTRVVLRWILGVLRAFEQPLLTSLAVLEIPFCSSIALACCLADSTVACTLPETVC